MDDIQILRAVFVIQALIGAALFALNLHGKGRVYLAFRILGVCAFVGGLACLLIFREWPL